MSPLVIWHDLIYLSDEYYCFILFTDVRSTVWLILNIHGIPLILLLMMYVRIVVFIRHQANNRLVLVNRNQKRDLLALRRIFIIVVLLFVIAMPTTIFILMALITRVEHPLTYRITMVSYAISMTTLSIAMLFVTPQLKTFILKLWKRNQVVPAHANLNISFKLGPIQNIR